VSLVYHAGQLAVQVEANTRRVADMLANWVGPVGTFVNVADILVIATADPDGVLRFACASGPAPLVDVLGDSTLLLPSALAESGIAPGLAGAIAINPAQRRRARLNGLLSWTEDGLELEAHEAFTNCRKYVAPSTPLEDGLHVGPVSRREGSLEDESLLSALARVETAFLASISPDGQPDVSHRGGPPGFFTLDAPARRLSWTEYVGDGMLKSAGNIRANGSATLLVIDLESGDAFELSGRAAYTTLRRNERPREDGLERHKEDFPTQGAMTLEIDAVQRLVRLISPRRRVETAAKITSCSELDEQMPQ